MMNKIACFSAFLILFVFQIVHTTPLSAETEETQSPKMSEREFFVAVQMPEYSEYTKKATQQYNDDKYVESIETSKKVLDLYNKRYEDIKSGYEKFGASKDAQKRFECFPLIQYAMASYANAAATEHDAYTISARYFMLLKAHKLFEYTNAEYPEDYKQTVYYSTIGRLLFNANTKTRFTEEEAKTYKDLIKSYDFSKEEVRTIKNAVEFIDKVDKIAKEYIPKPLPKPAEGSTGEEAAGLEGSTAEK